MHTAFWVGLKIYLPILVLGGLYLFAQTGPGKAAADHVIDEQILPELAEIEAALASVGMAMGASVPRFQTPVANAKFTSGRTLANAVFPSGRALSGGGFIKP